MIPSLKIQIVLDKTKLDGTMTKKAETAKISSLGWSPKISLEAGLKKIYLEYEDGL